MTMSIYNVLTPLLTKEGLKDDTEKSHAAIDKSKIKQFQTPQKKQVQYIYGTPTWSNRNRVIM